MSERVYVALDLETTGLDARQDAIIEIGAVRFACNVGEGSPTCRIMERFVTFVNPKRAIPLRIQQLTGIRDADVAEAPDIGGAAPELLSFVTPDVAAVVAHNADFDFGFLEAAGIRFHRPIQDTFELAAMLLPNAASYSLGELCRQLGISLPDAHRALDDAEATAVLFARLLVCAARLPAATVDILIDCGQDADWAPLQIFAEIQRIQASDSGFRPDPGRFQTECAGTALRGGSHQLVDRVGSDLTPFEQDGITQPVSTADVQSIFAPGGVLHRQLGEQFEMRSGQIAMAERVLAALNAGDHLLIEAGTGVGKSMGYLIPAALWSVRNQRRTVIATNTIALQDQLLGKDIPQVQALMQASQHEAPRASLLKGRSNYLCTRRLQAWYRDRRLSAVELRVLAKILIWLGVTRTGDVSELFLPTPAERMLWSRICCDAETCSADRCGGPVVADRAVLGNRFRDFFLLAHQVAETAHLLVVNHSMLLADIAAGGRVLPPYGQLIVDEAHRLEEAATDQLSYRVDWHLVRIWLRRLQRSGDLWVALQNAVHALQDQAGRRRLDAIQAKASSADDAVETFGKVLDQFARSQERLRNDSGYAQRLSLDRSIRTQPVWSEIEIDWDRASNRLRGLLGHLAELTAYLDEKQWRREEPYATYLVEMIGLQEKLAEFLKWADQIILYGNQPGETNIVTWLEASGSDREPNLVAAPLFVSETIEQELIHRKRSVVFTGATLRTGSGFAFIRDRLGLWDVPACTVESPFDYKSSTLLYLPRDVPEPNHGLYQQAVEEAIVTAAIASGGATVALFTSYAHLRVTADAIRAPLDRADITVLQHGSSSRQRLLREYRTTERAVLLGTRSFWEGIDLPGDELRCLLIMRLPFAVPSDPLVAARTGELENSFRDYTLPEAILRFRQGFGRLIRRATDRGVVVILDSRVWRKSYGRAFLESLPACTERHAPLANLGADIQAWLQKKLDV